MFKNYKCSSGGVTKDGNWIVLAECTKKGMDYIHKCGETILGKEITLSSRDGVGPFSGSGRAISQVVPFCPKCEREPISGTFGPFQRDFHIAS